MRNISIWTRFETTLRGQSLTEASGTAHLVPFVLITALLWRGPGSYLGQLSQPGTFRQETVSSYMYIKKQQAFCKCAKYHLSALQICIIYTGSLIISRLTFLVRRTFNIDILILQTKFSSVTGCRDILLWIDMYVDFIDLFSPHWKLASDA